MSDLGGGSEKLFELTFMHRAEILINTGGAFENQIHG